VKKVLVVDDEPALLDVLAQVLADEGYAVATARDGEHALRQAEQERPDLVLMDVMMPRLDGRDALRRLRAHPSLGAVPVILTSAGVPAAQVEPGVAFLRKPFDLDRLLALVARLLHEVSTAG
jgi:CheY-like chemotaxis protein